MSGGLRPRQDGRAKARRRRIGADTLPGHRGDGPRAGAVRFCRWPYPDSSVVRCGHPDRQRIDRW